MKLVIAYIRPERLALVKQALLRADITKMSVTNALGCGAEKGVHERYRGADVEIDLLKRARLEIALNEEYLERCIDTIVESAGTPGDEPEDHGDGKIFVIQLDQCIRIRGNERGRLAIG